MNSDYGPKLWSFLNDPISIARMQAVSDVGKPALLGVERGLINEFKIHAWADAEGKAKYDRLKQMIGAMVKQIMERTGYRLKSSNVKVPTSTIFYSTSLYTMDN
jgi:phage baseplate assembly protein W